MEDAKNQENILLLSLTNYQKICITKKNYKTCNNIFDIMVGIYIENKFCTEQKPC